MKTVREVVFNMDRQHIHIQKISVPREENKMEGEKCLEVQQKKTLKLGICSLAELTTFWVVGKEWKTAMQ